MRLLNMENMIVGKRYKLKNEEEIENINRNISNPGAMYDMPYGDTVTIKRICKISIKIEECKQDYSYAPQWFEEIKNNNMNLI